MRWWAAAALVAAVSACRGDRKPTPEGTEAPAPSSSASSPPGPAKRPATSGTIVFVSERAERHQVFVVDPRSGEERLLVDRPLDDYPGPPSPDGKSLVLVSAEDRGELHREQMWLWRSDGSLQKLGDPSSKVRNPIWLLDGSGVVVESNRSGFRDLFRVSLDGTSEQLTRVERGCFEPSLSPDGKTLAYVSSEPGNADVFTLSLAGDEPRRLTWSKGDDSEPAWSPDGAQIAFTTVRDGRGAIFVMSARGEKPHPVLAPASDAIGQSSPRWSPDGRRLAFVERHRERHSSVRVVGVDGEGALDSHDLSSPDGTAASDESHDDMPTWSPDGRFVAFSSDRSGDAEIYVWDLHAKRLWRITNHEGADWLPRWLPEGALAP